MLHAGVVAGLGLAAILLVALRAFRRRGPQRVRRGGAGDAFGDTAAGYQKDPTGWPGKDWRPEGLEDDETCPECNAVLIYGTRLEEMEDAAPGSADDNGNRKRTRMDADEGG